MPDDIAVGLDQSATRADEIQILEGSTFMLSDPHGDVIQHTPSGFFHEDTRHLSFYRLTIDGQMPLILTSGTVDYFSAAFYLTNPELDDIAAKNVSIQRFRIIGDGFRESVLVRNHLQEPVTLTLKLEFGVDFADLFEVRHTIITKGGQSTTEHDAEHCMLVFRYVHDVFEAVTRIHSRSAAEIVGDAFVFDITLGPRAEWETEIHLTPHHDDVFEEPVRQEFVNTERQAGQVLRKWRAEVPRLTADSDALQHTWERSVTDLAALRLFADVDGNEFALPAAGLPWFMAMFGRDTLITSFQSLLIGPDLAKGALVSFAKLQGAERNDFRDEEPGKILHELRFGELVQLGLRPHRPYYGSIDSTILYLILLSEYHRFTGDDALIVDLRVHAMRALEWIRDSGDLDGDGFVEYKMRSTQGLQNQSWKDSWNSMLFSDGTVANAPIAGVEIQGYVYDAKLRMAELADTVWNDPELATRLRAEADALATAFNDRFWVDDERGGFYAIALDGDKRPADVVSSNMGHLLWSGIVPKDRARRVADLLMSDEMFSGWGVRTLSQTETGYNPISYHNGTVWPHDNSIVAYGLGKYGFHDEANTIISAQLEAATFSDYRLPEVFAGYTRAHNRFPVRYPTACSPQAWAAASPFLWLRTMLGLEAKDGQLIASNHLPASMGSLRLHGLHAFGTHIDVVAEGNEVRVTPTR